MVAFVCISYVRYMFNPIKSMPILMWGYCNEIKEWRNSHFFFGNSHLNNMFIIHNVLQWNNGVPKTIVSKPNIEEIIQVFSNLKIGKRFSTRTP